MPRHGRADTGDRRLGNGTVLPRGRLCALHREPSGTQPRPHPASLARHQRSDRAVLRIAEVRALYRHEIDDGLALDEHVGRFLDVYNHRRPHEALQLALPIDRYLAVPTDDQPTTEDPNLQTT